MDVLVTLCKKPGTIISAEELLEQCWGSTLYGDNPVHKIIAQLRRLLGDQSSAPLYIETIRKRGYRAIATVQVNQIVESTVGSWTKESPFRGLQAFDEKHAAVFFGRNDAIFKLTQVVINQCQLQDSVEMVMVLGPSGSGKTSLIRAGLLPALINKPEALGLLSYSAFDLAEKGDHSLLTTLGGMLLDLETTTGAVFNNHSASSLALLIQNNPDEVVNLLRQSLAALPPTTPAIPQRHALFIDRFEAIFDEKQISQIERNAFLKILDKLARSQCLLIILACRNDFYPQIAAYPLLMEGKMRGAHFDLNPPSQAEIAQMIRLPALAAGLEFGEDEQSRIRLDDVLVEGAMGNPDALPLLQYTLHELYRLRTDDNQLSFAAFHQLGGIEGAIGQRAEQVINGLSEAQRQCLPNVLSLVTTISAQDAVVTSRRAAWSALRNDDERAVVNSLVESRLFVSELVDGASGFGVAHEALLRRWPRVVAWISAHRHVLQIRGRLGELAQRWQNEGQSQDLLLPEGKQLDEARSLLNLSAFALSEPELKLIAASTDRARWRKRLRLTALTIIILLALLATGLGLSALSAKRQALQRRTEVEGLMGFMLGDFADKLRPLARLDLLDSVGAKALDYFASSGNEDLSETALTQRAKALQVLAEVRITRGDPKAAEDALQAANLILLKQLVKDGKNQAVLKNLGANAFWLGRIYSDKGELSKTAGFYQQYLDYSNRLFQLDPDNVEWWIEQSYAHNNLGTLAFNRRDFHEADRQFRKSIELKTRALAKKGKDKTVSAELADSLSWLGRIKETLGELQAAMQFYEQEGNIVRELHAAAPGDGLWASRLAVALNHQGPLNLATGKTAEALKNYQLAEQLLTGLLKQEPSNRASQRNLATTQMKTQKILMRDGEPKAILATLQEVGNITRQLVQQNPKQKNAVLIDASLQILLARNLLQLKQMAEARAYLDDAEKRLQQLYDADPQDNTTQFNLVDALLTRSELESMHAEADKARTSCQRGRAVLEKSALNSADFRVLERWLRLHQCLGNQDVVSSSMRQLEKMGYRDSMYLQAAPTR